MKCTVIMDHSIHSSQTVDKIKSTTGRRRIPTSPLLGLQARLAQPVKYIHTRATQATTTADSHISRRFHAGSEGARSGVASVV